ncbi:MAG: zf-HC2 domain-containing protein [Thermoanaerobaculia bacterium]|nr:zf-HC2 domain-containing protein [Thermoanaerobaculia bacterium]
MTPSSGTPKPPASCREVVELLPWLAGGALEPAELALVERHLEGCAACREEAARCRAERGLLRAEAAPPPVPHPAQLERLFDRIDRGEGPEDEGDETARPAARTRRAGWLRRTPAPARWLLAAQLAALAGLGLWTLWDRPDIEPSFRTLGVAAAPAPAGDLRVVFSPTASEAEIRSLLLSMRAVVVAGPSPAGAYTLVLPADESRDAAVDLLRADPRIRLAEAVVGRDATR